ncbi:Autophagy-related protein 22 [Vanrija pseudolonga]|uniref:Autophagy-related protein 22 n=1 Tax=Vanrija pseudolonga TaxID=143232 RepID=A0AAF1BLC2_9TREE|nr:Autophagy-related protein 22 [Vanrija pseudolonga]
MSLMALLAQRTKSPPSFTVATAFDPLASTINASPSLSIPCGVPHDKPDDDRLSCLGLPLSLPYEVESLAEMDDRLELIVTRLTECVKAREWGLGFRMWNSTLNIWMSMGYPMKKEIRIRLIFLFYEIIFIPGMGTSFVEDRANDLIAFLSDRTLSIHDLRIPWRPLYDALYNELFPHPNKLARHSVNLAPVYLNVAEMAQRFFHPSEVDEMLEVILPQFDPSMDSILATQLFLVHFLPISHCQRWLPLIFRLWYGLNSGLWDDQASDLLGQLAIAHVDPARSDPSLIGRIPRGRVNTPEEQAKNPSIRRAERMHRHRILDYEGKVVNDEDGLNYWVDPQLLPPEEETSDPKWAGIRKDVGIFTEQEFEFVMSKCLRSLNVPVGGSVASQHSMSITASDARTSKKILDAKKPIDRTQSLAEVIIYSMAEDSPIQPFGTNGAPTRAATPGPSNLPHSDPVSRLKNGAATAMTRSGSNDSLAAAGERIERSRKYLAGSKALDHLSQLITSCETFFHPSNSGPWSAFLTVFLSHLTNNFVQRWKQEEEPTCKTPAEWRLTPEIKRAFVLCLRPVALTAMFNKDMESAQPAISTLRRLAILEPDLIMPAIMERAVPSLQGLEETQRTASVTFAIAAVAGPLSSRQLWRFGGMYIADILSLLLPGIDLNDPTKTGLSCMAICNMVDHIRVADISNVDEAKARAVKPGSRAVRLIQRPRVEDDPNDPVSQEFEDLSPQDVEERLRLSTGAFRDWVPEFLGRVLLLFANLPEEGGKTGRAGGKTEMLTLQSVLHTCGAIFAALDDQLFDAALEQVVEYATTTTRSNAVDAVGELVKNLAAANATKVFDRLFPICYQRITAELRSGASSTRTTTTSIPRPSDAALHWWQSIMYGLLVPGRISLPKHRAEYVDLLKSMIRGTYSERGWAWTGKIVEKTLSCLTALYVEEMHLLNKPDRESEDFKLNHTLWWGKLYRPCEALPQWRRPTDADVDMALEVIGLADEAVGTLEQLLDTRTGDQVWINEFCRAMNVVDEVLLGTYSLIQENGNNKLGGEQAPTSLPAEMWEALPAYKAGFLLTDPSDPRYIRVSQFRTRAGEMLVRAAEIMRNAGDSDSSVDSVKLLVTTIGSWLISYGMRSKKYQAASSAYDNLQASKRMYDGQRKQHRSVLLGAAQVHHSNRLMTASYYRVRSALDDKLIMSMLEFCLSPFVRVRRRAQSQFDSITKTYRGAWVLTPSFLFNALQPGTDPDRMKGALYVLRYNITGISRISHDWQGLVPLVECLLNAHHETKASVQTLVNKAIDELLAKLREPVTFRLDLRVEATDFAADDLIALLQHYKPSQSVIERTAQGDIARLDKQNAQYDLLIDRVRAKAADPTLNWRYVQAAARFLYAMTRRDRPTDPRLLQFFLTNVANAHPRIRDYGSAGLTRMLFQATVRTFSQESLERLFLQEPLDPFSRTLDLTKEVGPGFTEKYLASFREDPSDASVLQDRVDTGWLAWGRTMEVSRFSGWDEDVFSLEPACKPAVDLVIQSINDPAWWKQLAAYWSQEETRNYPSANHIDLILALCQVVGRPVLDQIRPLVDSMLADMETKKVYDRHVTRAMWEFLAGLLRGTWEWSGKDRKAFWDWFAPLLPDLFRNIRQDTIKCWDISVEYCLHEQDPRRYKPLLDFMLDTALGADFEGGSAFNLSRRVQLSRSVLRSLRWRFAAWSPDFEALYFKALDCPYAEVRALMASVLNGLDQLHWNASYPSATALVDTILSDPDDTKDIMGILHPPFMSRLQGIVDSLKEMRKDRPHGPKAIMSPHDTTAVTLMHLLSIELSDVHAVSAFPYIIPILPDIFELREMNDNTEMQGIAGRLLAWITSITPAFVLVEPLVKQLIGILQNSTSWRTKMHCMPVLSLTYFRNLALLSEPCKAKCLDVISTCLKDPNQEVREMASVTLAGFLRCSQRSMVLVLKDRFTREIGKIKLPRRVLSPGQVNPEYQTKLVELHAAVLGAVAIVEAFPYTVPKFIPPLLADTLAPRVSEPMPISATIRSCIASFKRTHEKYQERMTEDQLAQINYAQAGNSYCELCMNNKNQDRIATGVMKVPERHVLAWYTYAFAAEVFVACALAIFLPITLERMAREIGFEAPELTKPCALEATTEAVCKARILGKWVDTTSFSMYVKSAAVLTQALVIISIGALADSAYWRKKLLLSFATVGSSTGALFLVIPSRPSHWLPLVAAAITIVGNFTYGASIVCANAFLPGLAREDPTVAAAKAALDGVSNGNGEGGVDAPPDTPAGEEDAPLLDDSGAATAKYAALFSATTARLSSTGVAIGFFSGVAMLALLAIPVAAGGGSTRSLSLAVGLSGLWWGVWTVPAGLGLPSGPKERAPRHWLRAAWVHVGSMIRPSEMKTLPNLFTYLLAWVFLSDGFHTTTYTAILYASSTLHMSAAKVIVIGLLVQLFAVVSSILAPRVQARLGLSNLYFLIYVVVGAQVLPLYACAGLVLPFGGLRTEAEMYVAAAWFGFVSCVLFGLPAAVSLGLAPDIASRRHITDHPCAQLYGPFNSYARAVYAELIPPGHESTFFSLFSLTDKSASFIGPFIVGIIADVSGNIRLGFVFLTLMLALPVPVLLRVRMHDGVQQAAAWSVRKAETWAEGDDDDVDTAV